MAHGVQPSAPAAACCNRRPSARRAIYLCKIPGAPLLSSGTRAAMHTALIGDYLVHFRSIGPAAPTASAPRLHLPRVDVPAAADAHPIHASVSSGPGGQCAVALYTGGGECSALSAGELCEIAYEGPPPDWVRELVGKYGGKMVFDAVREYAVAANGGDRI